MRHKANEVDNRSTLKSSRFSNVRKNILGQSIKIRVLLSIKIRAIYKNKGEGGSIKIRAREKRVNPARNNGKGRG